MRCLYTDSNRLLVSNAKNIVENAHIPFVVKNEYAGGAVGDLSATDSWLEVWVEDDDFEKANDLLAVSLSQQDSAIWMCSQCDEKNEPSFDYCWNCQNEKPE